MATKQELIELLEAEINRAKTVVQDLQDRKESLRQEILQEELDNLEKYIISNPQSKSRIKDLAQTTVWQDKYESVFSCLY